MPELVPSSSACAVNVVRLYHFMSLSFALAFTGGSKLQRSKSRTVQKFIQPCKNTQPGTGGETCRCFFVGTSKNLSFSR